MIRLAPVYFTEEWDLTVSFLSALGFSIEAQHRKGDWSELAAPNALLFLHAMPNDEDNPLGAGDCELSFESDEAPDAVAHRLAAAGFDDSRIVDASYGHILYVTGPDQRRVQINFSDRTLYTR